MGTSGSSLALNSFPFSSHPTKRIDTVCPFIASGPVPTLMSQYCTPEGVFRGGPETLVGVAAGVGDGNAAVRGVLLVAGLVVFLVCALTSIAAMTRLLTRTNWRICAPLARI